MKKVVEHLKENEAKCAFSVFSEQYKEDTNELDDNIQRTTKNSTP